jgi:hypothetical protein
MFYKYTVLPKFRTKTWVGNHQNSLSKVTAMKTNVKIPLCVIKTDFIKTQLLTSVLKFLQAIFPVLFVTRVICEGSLPIDRN